MGLGLCTFLALEALKYLPKFLTFWTTSLRDLERVGWAAHFDHPSDPFLMGRCFTDTARGGCNASHWMEARNPLPWTWNTAYLLLTGLGSLFLGWTLLWKKTPPPPVHEGHLALEREYRPLLVKQTRATAKRIARVGHTPHITHSLLLAAPPRSRGRYLANFPTASRREYRHMLLVGESGSGKGDTIVANLLNWAFSSVVLDLGGEAWERTAGYRSSLGSVYLLDFSGMGHAYSPFETMKDDLGVSELADLLADTHAGDSERGAEFRRKAANGFKAALHLALERGEKNTLRFLLETFSSQKAYREAMEGASPRVQQLAALFLGEDAFSLNSFSLAQNGIATLDVRGLHLLFSRSDFQVEELKQKPTTIYLKVDAASSAELKAYRLLMRCLLGELKKHHAGLPVLVVADELDSNPIPDYPNLISTLRKYGVTLLTSVQDLSQLETHYGRTGKDTILNSSSFTVFLRQNNPRNLEHIALLSGMTSVDTLSRSESERDKRKNSQTHAQSPRKVLEPMEVYARGDSSALLLAPGLPLIDCTRLEWRRDKVLLERSGRPAPDPKELFIRRMTQRMQPLHYGEALEQGTGKELIEVAPSRTMTTSLPNRSTSTPFPATPMSCASHSGAPSPAPTPVSVELPTLEGSSPDAPTPYASPASPLPVRLELSDMD